MKSRLPVFAWFAIEFVIHAEWRRSFLPLKFEEPKHFEPNWERNKKEDETFLENKEKERGRLTFFSTRDVGPNADHDECQKGACES